MVERDSIWADISLESEGGAFAIEFFSGTMMDGGRISLNSANDVRLTGTLGAGILHAEWFDPRPDARGTIRKLSGKRQ
jgi:hypothetical protein